MGLTKSDLELIWNNRHINNTITEVLGVLKHVEQLEPLETILEIGVAWGGSLRLWEQVVPVGGTVIGVDINPRTAERISGKLVQPKSGLRNDWVILERTAHDFGEVLKLESDRNVYVVVGDSTDPKTSETVRRLLGPRKIDFIFHDGLHFGTGPIEDYANFQHLFRTDGALCIADVADFNNENCGCQELYRVLPEPKIPYTTPKEQGMSIWWKPEDFVLDLPSVLEQVKLTTIPRWKIVPAEDEKEAQQPPSV